MIYILFYLPWEFKDFEEKESPIKFLDPESLKLRALEKGEWSKVGDIFYAYKVNQFNWQFIGPSYIEGGSWSDGLSNSGRITFILTHPTNPNIIYVATAGGGVWKTIDQGLTWTPLTDNLPTLTSGALAFDPSNPDIIYYGTGEMNYCSVCFPGDGLFKSVDGGNTWAKIANSNQVGSYISRIIINPVTHRILVASDFGVVYSDDGGNTWLSSNIYDQVNDLVYRSDSPNVLFAASLRTGIYKSTDGGLTWVKITSLPTSGYFRSQIAISKSNPNIIYVAFGSNNYYLYAFYKSTDGGNTWTQLNNVPEYLCGQGFYNHALIVKPNDPNTIIAGGVHNYGSSCQYGIIKSVDGGISWSEVAKNVIHPDIHHFAYGPDGTLYVATDGGIWKSYNDGNSWININKGLGTLQFYTLAIKPNDDWIITGGTQDNGTPILYNLPVWREVSGGDGGPTIFELQNPNYFWTSYIYLWYFSKYQLTSGYPNPSWQYLFYKHPWFNDRADWANGAVDVHQDGTIIVGTYRLWISTDGGYNWSPISPSLAGASGVLLSAKFSYTNSDTIYTGSNQGHFYFTYNQGTNWVNRSSNLGVSPSPIRKIIVNPNNSKNIYVCAGRTNNRKILFSNDAGQTWNDITGNLPSGRTCRTFAIDFQRNIIFVGMEDGVFYSKNNGQSWQKMDGIPNTYVFAMDIVNNKLIVATHGRSMWKLDILTDVKEVALNDYIIKGNKVIFPREFEYKIYKVDGSLYIKGLSKEIALPRGVYILKVKNFSSRIVIY